MFRQGRGSERRQGRETRKKKCMCMLRTLFVRKATHGVVRWERARHWTELNHANAKPWHKKQNRAGRDSEISQLISPCCAHFTAHRTTWTDQEVRVRSKPRIHKCTITKGTKTENITGKGHADSGRVPG